MALNTTKLHSSELDSDCKLNEMEIGTPSNGFFERLSDEPLRSRTVSELCTA